MLIKNLRPMATHEIIRQYREAQRDFRGIRCTNADFNGLDLSGADFSGSGLGFSKFMACDLTNANLSNCNLVWSNFPDAIMRNTNLSGSRINWCGFNNAVFENTNMEKADISWSILFKTNRGAVSLKGANETMVAWDISEVTESGLNAAKWNLEQLKTMIPYDLWLQIKYKVEGTESQHFKHQKNSGELGLSKYLDQIGKGEYESQNREVLKNMGLGAYAKGASLGYAGFSEEKYKGRKRNAYQR